MEIKIQKGLLLDALSLGGSMSGKSKVLPILDFSKLVIKGNSLVVCSYDGDVAVSTRCAIDDGDYSDTSFCINTRDLLSLLKTLKDDNIVLNIDNSLCRVIHNKGVLELGILSSDDFPTADVGDNTSSSTITLDCERLYDWCVACRNFLSQDSLRPILSGMYLYCDNGECGCVGTDGHKMYWNHINDDAFNELKCDGVISSNALGVLVNMVALRGTIHITFSDKNLKFKTQNAQLLCRKIDGKFPSFKSIIPNTSSYRFDVELDDIRDTINRLSLVSGTNRLIKLDIDNDRLKVETCDLDFSRQGSETIQCTSNNASLSIGVNGSHILTCINAIKNSDRLCVELESPQRAIVFKDDNATILLMPMATH